MPRPRVRARKAKKPKKLSQKRRSELLSLFALKQLPHDLRSDVLTRRAPDEISSVSSVPVISIGGHSVPRTVLFETLRAAMGTGQKQRMAMKNARADVTVAAGGRAAVRIRDTSYIIANVDLAAEDGAVRATAVERMTAKASFSAATGLMVETSGGLAANRGGVLQDPCSIRPSESSYGLAV